MKNTSKIALALILLTTTIVSPHALSQDKKRNVIILNINGLQYEEIFKTPTPNLDRLNITKAYTGGIYGTHSEQKLITNPSEVSILTGVWANKHLIKDNRKNISSGRFPSILNRIKTQKNNSKVAAIVNQPSVIINNLRADLEKADTIEYGLTDDEVINHGLDLIKQRYDMIYLSTNSVYQAGRKFCFGDDYSQSITKADQQIGDIRQAIAQSGDDWLFIVTTDHGLDSKKACISNGGHQTIEEKTIFIATNKPMNEEFSDRTTEAASTDFNHIYSFPAQTSIAPTVYRYLGITINLSWYLDGSSLLGNHGVRKLMTRLNRNFIQWAPIEGDVDIYRDNVYLDTVDGKKGLWKMPVRPLLVYDYSFDNKNSPVGIRLYPTPEEKSTINIKSAINYNNGKIYLFRTDNKYIRWSLGHGKVDSGYPKPINDKTWRGLNRYKNDIVASFNTDKDKSYIFLRNGTYLRFDTNEGRVDKGYPLEVNEQSWPGLKNYANKIVAALHWSSKTVYFFLNNATYLKYDLDSNRVENGYPLKINEQNWPGLAKYAAGISGALKYDSNRAYIFFGDKYVEYNSSSNHVEGALVEVSIGWPGAMKP
ncbi:alkaline phosphatase family protein [Vibrio mediterranei]|uniref:Metalloenzyme domain-containing protein n=1 Tax=Vibrio mediterranei TaxID=689 RepID=A0AAN1FLZ1_9VIBR|nr:alkaline phosphatase family protein [Vibrio mediterranei]ASI93062.1 hypothetical protein BSZ05_25275 [Vibrio mediterranei]